jgi:hypothetical protein
MNSSAPKIHHFQNDSLLAMGDIGGQQANQRAHDDDFHGEPPLSIRRHRGGGVYLNDWGPVEARREGARRVQRKRQPRVCGEGKAWRGSASP